MPPRPPLAPGANWQTDPILHEKPEFADLTKLALSVTFDVKPGRMVVFPAWLTHSVPVNASGHDRISFAFNLMFREYVRLASPALWRGTVKVDV